jgi:hypothetical protein
VLEGQASSLYKLLLLVRKSAFEQVELWLKEAT